MGSRAFVSVDETPTDTLREMRTARELPQPQSAIRRLLKRKQDNDNGHSFAAAKIKKQGTGSIQR